jgi:hypothetical protein
LFGCARARARETRTDIHCDVHSQASHTSDKLIAQLYQNQYKTKYYRFVYAKQLRTGHFSMMWGKRNA